MVTYFAVPDKTKTYRGDDEVITFTVYSDEEHTTKTNITGATFKYTVRQRWDSATYIFQKAGAITDAPNGALTVTIADTDTNTLDPWSYPCDLEMTLSGNIYTCYRAALTIMSDVT